MSPYVKQKKILLTVRHPNKEVQILQVNYRNGSPYKVSSMIGNDYMQKGTHMQGNSPPLRCSQTIISDSTLKSGLIKGTCEGNGSQDHHFKTYVSQNAYTSS